MIVRVDFSELRPFVSRASRDHVSLSNTRDTIWWAQRPEADIVGFAGLLSFHSNCRIKGVWVRPESRGQGIGDQLARHLISWAENDMAATIEAFAYNPAYYEALGFSRYGVLPNGAIKLRRVL